MFLHMADGAMASHVSLQGLADAFILLGMPFDSAEAKQLNKEIFEAIYFSALETSCELAKLDGARPLFSCAGHSRITVFIWLRTVCKISTMTASESVDCPFVRLQRHISRHKRLHRLF